MLTATAASGRLWFWAGLVFVAVAVAFLELVNPLYFCQDDALVGELPSILLAMRATWQGMPVGYNPFIFMGSPIPSLAGFYPPLHLSYAIARDLLGNEYATLDVFAIAHIIAGYCFTFALARRLGAGPVFAAIAGLTYVLSGSVLVMARCWHAFSVLAAFIPLFALFVDHLRTGPVTWRWSVGLGLALGCYYHAGFPQLFVLGCGIMLVHAAVLAGGGFVPWRRLAWLVPSLALGAAVAMPLFYQQWRFSRELPKNEAAFGWGIGSGLVSMLLPYPLAGGSLPNGWGNENLQWGGHFYYFGTVLLAGFLAAVFAVARRWAGAAQGHAGPDGGTATAPSSLQLTLVIPAVVALLLSLGEWGGLWWLMDRLPVGLRNNPFRVFPWFVLYACVSGARFFEGFVSDRRPAAGRSAEAQRLLDRAGIAGVGLMLVGLHLTRVVGISFYTYGFRPYPPLPRELAAILGPDEAGHQQRFLSSAALQSSDPSYPLAVPRNLPCVYGIPGFFGYDPVIERLGRYTSCVQRVTANPQAALAAYGVRWLLVHRIAWSGDELHSENPLEKMVVFGHVLASLVRNPQVSLPELNDFVRVFEIPDAAPLAFDVAEPARPLPLRMTAAGLDIDLRPTEMPRSVVANFLRYPDISATADGKPVEVSEDEWQRIVMDVPPGATAVRIRYSPPLAPGRAVALVLAIVGGASLLVCRRVCDERLTCRHG